jgi:hypothetical protein
VSATDAVSIINRLGYRINPAVAGAGEPAESEASPSVALSMALVELDETPGVVVGEQFEIDVHFTDLLNGDRAVFSGYADISFDSTLVQVDEIVYDADYGAGQTGAIGNGVVRDVGAADGTTPPEDTRVFTLQATALATGTARFTTEAADDGISEIVIFGSDDDQRGNTEFGTLDVEIVEARGWTNKNNKYDVNGDGEIVPGDLLLIVNELNSPKYAVSNRKLPQHVPAGAFYYDVNGDTLCTPFDALPLVNYLNTEGQAEGEGPTALPQPAVSEPRGSVGQFSRLPSAANQPPAVTPDGARGDQDEPTSRLEHFFATAAEKELVTIRHDVHGDSISGDDSEAHLENVLAEISPDIGAQWDSLQ